jgi:hypothetical protein
MNDLDHMRQLIQLIESAEQLDEGPVGKALATAALTLGLNYGNQVNAEEVFVYQDMQGQLQTVSSFMQIPKDAQMSYAIDTDTKEISYIKKPGEPNQGELTPIPKDAPVQSGAPLYGKLTMGMTLEQVQQLVPGGKVAKKQFGEVKAIQPDPAMYRTFDAPGGYKKMGATYYHFNADSKLTGLTFHYNLPDVKGWAVPIKRFKKWSGYDVNIMPMVITELLKIMPQEVKPSAIGKTQVITGGQTSVGFSLSKLVSMGSGLGALGINLGGGKMGDLKFKIKTDKGHILIDGSFTNDSAGHNFTLSGLTFQNGIFVIINK